MELSNQTSFTKNRAINYRRFLSPDGSLAALRDLDGRVTVYRTSSGEKIWQAQANSGPGSIAFSSQGLLAVASSAEIELLDLARGLRKYSFTTSQPDEVPMLLRFSSNDDTLMAVWQSGHADFFAFRLPAGMTEIARLTDTSVVQGIVPDDAKRWAVGWTKEGSVIAFNLAADGTAPKRWRVKEELAAVVPAGSTGRWKLLAVSGAVYVIGFDSAEPVQISPPADGVQAVTRSISDETWAFVTRNGTIKISSGALVQGPAEIQILLLNGKAGLVAALSGDSVKVWDYAKPVATLILDVSVEDASSATFSTDGLKIAVGDGGGNVHLYGLAGAHSVAVFHPHVALVSDLVFDHSGNLLASVSMDGTKALIQIQSGSAMIVAGNHNMEASHIAISEELGLIASAGEDGGILLNGLAHGGLIARIPVGDGRATAMLFAGGRLFLGTDGGSLRSISLNTLQAERLELLRLSVGRTLRDDEKRAFGLSSEAYESAEQAECRVALVHTSNPYASLTGIILDPRQFRGQADACIRAVSRHPEQPCWSQAAGLILRRQAEAFEAVGMNQEALKPREEDYALTRTSAAQGCLDAMLDIVSLKEGGLADDQWVRGQLQDVADKGSGKAEAAISQLDWDHAKSEAERQQVLDKLLAAGTKGHAWALAKRAALLADEGIDRKADKVFRDSVRAGFLFDACGVNDPALDQAVGLRALALADLDEGSALRALTDERKLFEAVAHPDVCEWMK
jgi:WD40 repeat protein